MKKFAVTIFILLFTPILALADTVNYCAAEKQVVIHPNTVNKTHLSAVIDLMMIKASVEASNTGKMFEYELFYNNFGSVVGESSFEIPLKKFSDTLLEIDSSFVGRNELFWLALSSSPELVWGALQSDGNELLLDQQVLGGLLEVFATVQRENADITAEVLSNPPVQGDFLLQETRVKTLAVEGNEIVLISHGQGSVIAQLLFQASTGVTGFNPENIVSVAIAPVTHTFGNNYVVSENDPYIFSLAEKGLSFEFLDALNIPYAIGNTGSNSLSGAYLRQGSHTAGAFSRAVANAVSLLQKPDGAASEGSLTATLTWNGTGDVDLHTFTPAAHVYFLNKVDDSGFLDVDNVVRDGPEHFYAPCDGDKLLEGVYYFTVSNYSQAQGRTATLQISTPRIANVITRTVVLGQQDREATREKNLIAVDVKKQDGGIIDVTVL